MGLVEVAGSVDRIEDARAVAQQLDGMAGALDLPELCVRDAGSTKKVSLNGPLAQHLRVALDGSFDGRFDRNEPALGKPADEDLGVLVAGDLPGLALEPPSSHLAPVRPAPHPPPDAA